MPPRKSYRHTDDEFLHHLSNVTSWDALVRALGYSPGQWAYDHVKKRAVQLNADVGHFRGRGQRLPPDEMLTIGTRRKGGAKLTRSLLDLGRPYSCEDCGLGDQWNGDRLVLEVDHIDRNPLDNRPHNLRFLCPNCHSQYGTKTARQPTRDGVVPGQGFEP